MIIYTEEALSALRKASNVQFFDHTVRGVDSIQLNFSKTKQVVSFHLKKPMWLLVASYGKELVKEDVSCTFPRLYLHSGALLEYICIN